MADVTLKNSGDAIDAVVDEQVAGGKQEAHVPVRFLLQSKYLLLHNLSPLFVICKDDLYLPEWVKFTHECIDSALIGARAKTRTFFFTCNASHLKSCRGFNLG